MTMLLSFEALGQSTISDTTDSFKHFQSLEELLPSSRAIHNETFDLKFLIRALPDNGWFLQLNEDSSYEYIQWSGWGEPEGQIIETGSYNIIHNKLILKSFNAESQLDGLTFSLITSEARDIENHINVDCVEKNAQIYCLYMR